MMVISGLISEGSGTDADHKFCIDFERKKTQTED